MNPASRLYEFLSELQKKSTQTVAMMDVYKKVLDTDNLYEIYEILHFHQQSLSIIEQELVALDKIDKYKILLDSTKKFILPISLMERISVHHDTLRIITPQFMVLSDSFENKKYHEKDISEDLDKFDKDLDDFLESIMTLDLDDETKHILVMVVHKLKSSMTNYKYRGVKALMEDLLFFKCILQKNEKTKGLFDKLLSMVKKAKDVEEAVGFIANSADEVTDYINLLSN